MESGIIAKWHKKEGDKVEAGELLLEIITDKATIEHSALDEGWLKKILVKENEQAAINQAIAIFTASNTESIEGYQPEGSAPVKKQAVAEPVSKDEVKEETKSKVPAGSALAQPHFAPEAPLKNYKFPFSTEPTTGKIPASPLAKKLAKENNLDLSSVKGSGPGGRVMSEDLNLAQAKGAASFSRGDAPTAIAGSYEEESLSPVQMIVASRLQASKTFIPHFYLNQNVEVSSLMRVRSELKNQNINLSFNDFIIRASALALRQHPNINSGFNSETQSIIRFKTVDISIAVSLEQGLITPIVRFADYKNLGQISGEVKDLARKARENKLAMDEFKGGSFTISNLGMYGTTSVLPVINPPQAAILGVGGISAYPKIEGGELVERHQMVLTLAGDHRVVNGEDGAKFLKTLKELIENPSILLI